MSRIGEGWKAGWESAAQKKMQLDLSIKRKPNCTLILLVFPYFFFSKAAKGLYVSESSWEFKYSSALVSSSLEDACIKLRR